MKGTRGDSLDDRRSSANDARKAMLEKFRQKVQDPGLQDRLAVRKAQAEARDARQKERDEQKAAEKARIEAEQLAAEKARIEAEEARKAAELDEMMRLEAERKAARDARYAARKARKQGNRR